MESEECGGSLRVLIFLGGGSPLNSLFPDNPDSCAIWRAGNWSMTELCERSGFNWRTQRPFRPRAANASRRISR